MCDRDRIFNSGIFAGWTSGWRTFSNWFICGRKYTCQISTGARAAASSCLARYNRGARAPTRSSFSFTWSFNAFGARGCSTESNGTGGSFSTVIDVSLDSRGIKHCVLRICCDLYKNAHKTNSPKTIRLISQTNERTTKPKRLDETAPCK